MKETIEELWHGNIIPQEDSRTNSPEMKELLSYISRHHEDLEKSMTDEQKEIFQKFQDCWSEYTCLAEEAIFVYAFRLGSRMWSKLAPRKCKCGHLKIGQTIRRALAAARRKAEEQNTVWSARKQPTEICDQEEPKPCGQAMWS